MILIAILLGTVLAGVGSVWLAAVLGLGVLSRYTQHMLSLAAGALLGTAFLHMLPEAFEMAFEVQVEPHVLFAILLVGVVFFFLLDKAELWHHGHEHHQGLTHGHNHGHQQHEHASIHAHAGHEHHHHEHAHTLRSGGWAVLAGDSVHAFGDGVMIAAAFLADWHLGVSASLAVLAHEVPHHMGDLMVLRETSGTRRAALLKVSLAGTVTALGGLLGYLLLQQLADYKFYFLTVAASSFVYVALADLIPQLQKKLSMRSTLAQVAWLLAGIAMVAQVSSLAHAH